MGCKADDGTDLAVGRAAYKANFCCLDLSLKGLSLQYVASGWDASRKVEPKAHLTIHLLWGRRDPYERVRDTCTGAYIYVQGAFDVRIFF